MQHEKILIMDFGGQYNQLIGRRVRDLNVFCEIASYRTPIENIIAQNYKGIIFTGGPNSVYQEGAPTYDPKILELGIPVLGICYGAQLLAKLCGGKVDVADIREYGRVKLKIEDKSDLLFQGVKDQSITWMSHTDRIYGLPQGFKITASTDACPIAAMSDPVKKLYAVQFHPEVNHSEEGTKIIRNFLYNICQVKGDWTMEGFVEDTVASLKKQLYGRKVVCAFSGGVDSSVAALLIHKAIGQNLHCIFVDHGLLRLNEAKEVEQVFKDSFHMNLKLVDARQRFYDKLKGITDPEQKRKIIGAEFIDIFREEAEKIGEGDVLAQGTIYPDVVESGLGDAKVIKSHHNVGGLPKDIGFKELVEPLRMLFKDEVRRAGEKMGIPEHLVWRQPFPGPGLAVRIIGEVTPEKVALLQKADAIFREEVSLAGLSRKINQYFAVLTDMRSVGVMGDSRTYDYTLALRGVTTTDFMTADWARIPYDVLERCSNRIVNEVGQINRVVYDITSKPPATIEWE